MSARRRMDAPAAEKGITLAGHVLLGGLMVLLQLWLASALLGLGLGEVLSRAGQGLAEIFHAILFWSA